MAINFLTTRIYSFMAPGLRHGQCESEGEVRGRPQEGDQETPEVPRSDQNMDSVQRDQG